MIVHNCATFFKNQTKPLFTLKLNLIQVYKPLVYFNDTEPFPAFCNSLVNHELEDRLKKDQSLQCNFAQRRQDFEFSTKNSPHLRQWRWTILCVSQSSDGSYAKVPFSLFQQVHVSSLSDDMHVMRITNEEEWKNQLI